jgi:hypothetical protein
MGLFDWLFGKKEPASRNRVQPSPAAAWQVGDRVLASWMDAYFYPGRIRQIQGDSCEIAFDDGDMAWVHRANVRKPDIRAGSQVFCRFHGGPAYLSGSVRTQNGEKIQVEYENGEKEWTTLSMVRVERPLANVGSPPAQVHQGPMMPMNPGTGAPMMGGPPIGTMTAAGPMMGPPTGPYIPDVGAPVTDSNWRSGDRVLGRWFDLFWYPATILAIGTKGYHLLFDDGDQRLVNDLGLMPIDVEEGEEVFIRP